MPLAVAKARSEGRRKALGVRVAEQAPPFRAVGLNER